MSLKGRKVALFVADGYEDRLFWYPYYRLKESGAEVVVIGPNGVHYKGSHGLLATADQNIDGANAEGFDAVIIPGGQAPHQMRRSSEMVAFVQQIFQLGRVVAAICRGSWMLATAGIVTGLRVTSFPALREQMTDAGANWVNQEVVSDGNVITSREPDDLPAFCRAISDALGARG
jgi:protease I